MSEMLSYRSDKSIHVIKGTQIAVHKQTAHSDVKHNTKFSRSHLCFDIRFTVDMHTVPLHFLSWSDLSLPPLSVTIIISEIRDKKN